MPNFGSSRSESSPPTLGPLPSMPDKVTQRLRQQQDDQLFEMDAGSTEPVETPQFHRQGQIEAEFIMGTVDDLPTQNGGKSHSTNYNATEIQWQHQTQVGDSIVFHHLKDDGKGRLSFFRASVISIPVREQESRTPSTASTIPQSDTSFDLDNDRNRYNPTLERHFTKVPAANREVGQPENVVETRVISSDTPEAASFFVPNLSVENYSSLINERVTGKVEEPLKTPDVDMSGDPSARSAIGVGLAVNLLAITVGGYLLQFSPGATEANVLSAAREANQIEAIASNSVAVSSNSLTTPEAPASIELENSQRANEAEAHQLLQQAYNRAIARDFAGALDSLDRIPSGTSAYEFARAKILEYTEKQRYKLEVEAHQLLQQAYNRAESKDFAAALGFIKQIPKGTLAHAQVQTKLVEYSKKQRQWTETLEATGIKPSSNAIAAASQQPMLQSAPSLEISKRSDVPGVFPSVDSSAKASSLNPGDLLQEIDPHSVVLCFPETKIGS